MVTQSIPLVADLRTQNRNIGTIYLATGLVTEGDTGGGIYFWNPASTNADDGFYYLQVTGVATGRWVRIYAGSNIYNTDGSLLDNRDVTLNGNYLKFIGSSANSTFNADGSVTLGSLSGVNTRMVVAGSTGTLSTQSFVPGTTIRFVEKFTAIAGQTVFNTANTLYGDLFDVFLNGVKLNTDSFSFTANQITLLDGSYAGDIIDVVGFSSVTVYATLPSQAGNAGKFLSTDGTSLSWETVSASGFVPYIGATGNVDLGEFELKAGQLSLDVSPTGTAAVGTTRWNNTIGSSETTLKGGSVILKNGVDLVARIVNKVSPNTTLTKANYQAVRVSGAQGQRLAVAFAQANNDANSADTIGLVCETIPTNQEGFIITMGQLENINTTGSLQGETWADGDVLYLSPFTPGAITKVKPTGAGHIVVIGYVEYAHVNNGKIYVKVMNGWELDELHDVDIVSPANNEALIYESSTQLWKNKTIALALGYTPISGSGVTGQVAYWNGTNSQTGSNNLFWDAANSRLGIGTNAPAYRLHNVGTSAFDNGNSGDAVTILNSGFLRWTSVRFRGFASSFDFQDNAFSTKVSLSMSGSSSIFNTGGNFLFGGSTDGGQRLQVYGDAYIKGSGNTSATSALLVQDGTGAERFKVLNDGVVELSNRLKLNTIAGLSTGTVNIDASFSLLNSSSGSYTRIALGSQSVSSSGNFTSSGFQDNVVTNITATSTLDYTSFYANPTLTALTAGSIYKAFGWSNNSGWGLYGAGTAPNLLSGVTLIRTNASSNEVPLLVENYQTLSGFKTVSIDLVAVNGDARITAGNQVFANGGSGFLSFSTRTAEALTEKVRIDSAGRLLVGTTSSTFLLDVNGTARVSGNTTISFNQNATTSLIISNTTTGISSQSILQLTSNLGNAQIGKRSTTTTPYKTISSSDTFLYNSGDNGDITLLNDFASGRIRFTTGGVSTPQMTLTAAGRLLLGLTAESTFLLDVNGTARVSGNLTLGTTPTIQSTTGNIILSSVDVPSRTLTYDTTNNTLTFSQFGTAGFVGARFYGQSDPNTFVSPDGLNSLGSAKITAYDSAGNAAITASNNGNRSIVLKGLGSTGSVLIGAITTGNGTSYNAILRADSTTQGFMPPRMTTTQKNAIATPTAGLMVYDTTLNKLCVYTTAWETITSI